MVNVQCSALSIGCLMAFGPIASRDNLWNSLSLDHSILAEIF